MSTVTSIATIPTHVRHSRDGALPPARATDGRDESEALDAYSTVVTRVADALLPCIASVQALRSGRGGRDSAGSGSAVVITPDGYLLTSAHVVRGSEHGRLAFPDGRTADFVRAGADPLSDLAVLRTDLRELSVAPLGDASRLRTGQLVVAIGSPLGYMGSVSAGVVSAIGRSFATSDGRISRIVENVIQTDAALHPGNSGGALANGRGEVVGINTAVIGSVVGQGLGLAVPINETARRVVSALIRDGRVRRAYLGIAGGSRPLPPRVAASAGQRAGIEVSEVMADSPASRVGLRPGDLIVSIGGRTVEDVGALQEALSESTIGRPMDVGLVRANAVLSLTIEPVELGG